MSFLMFRANIPTQSLGVIQETGFENGNTIRWAEAFNTAYQSSLGSGTILNGRIRISENMMSRVLGASAPIINQQLQHITTFSQEYGGLELYVDQSLSDDTVILD